MIRFYCRIVTEQLNGFWAAWFHDTPDHRSAGDSPELAVWRLVELFGAEQFQSAELSAVDHATHDGHFEFMIPLRNMRRVPILLHSKG